MAQDSIFPKRPANDSDFASIKANDRDCLSYSVAFNVPNERAFSLFHPEFLDEQGKLTKVGKTQCRQFFSYAKNKEYQDSYAACLKSFIGKKNIGNDTDITNDIDDSRKDKVLKQLLGQAMSLVESGEDLDPDTMKTVVEVFRKLGILKDEVEVEIKPLRFLPERCYSSCRYRLFVENAVKGGAVLDECQYCKAIAYANENGYKDDSTNRLDIPQEVLDAEPENTVKTLDILSGKVQN